MKRLPRAAAMVLLGLTMTTHAQAGHFGPSRGRHLFVGGHVALRAPAPRLALSFEFGYPAYFPYGGYYAPAPWYYYNPYPPVVEPVCAYPIWTPPRYVWRHGTRFFVAGHWRG